MDIRKIINEEIDKLINPNNLIGLKPTDISVFSDIGAFEYHNNPKDYYNKIIGVGDNLIFLDNSGEYHRIKDIEYDSKTRTYQRITDISDREMKYGEKMPKSGSFNVLHGSPYGKIDKFDEKMFGKGYQREELAHERFAGIYVSDDTKENELLGTGYGDVHKYQINFNNSINEETAENFLRKHERELDKRLNRIEATNYIKSLGYDVIYRTFDDTNNMEFIVLSSDNIKPL